MRQAAALAFSLAPFSGMRKCRKSVWKKHSTTLPPAGIHKKTPKQNNIILNVTIQLVRLEGKRSKMSL